MGRICCIANCQNSARDKRNLFVVPKCGEQRREWFDAISPYIKRGRQHRKHFYVCDAHFSDNDIIRKRVISSKDGPIDVVPCFSIRLKLGSVPSIFNAGIPPTIDLPAVKNNRSNTLTSEASGGTKASDCEQAQDVGDVSDRKRVITYTLNMLEQDLQLRREENDFRDWGSVMHSSGLSISFFGNHCKAFTKTIFVTEDMSAEMRDAGQIIMKDFKEKIKSVDDMLSLMKKLKINHSCQGCDDTTPCPNGYFESSTAPRYKRCILCQIKRKKN